MTRELITRADLKGLDMAARWLLASGHTDQATIQGVIQLLVSGADGKVVRLDLDVHDAGDLYHALEEHMENVAAAEPMTPEERDRALRKGKDFRKANLRAVQDEIDRPLRLAEGRTVTPAVAAALEDAARAWTSDEKTLASKRTIQGWAPALAAALDRLADHLT